MPYFRWKGITLTGKTRRGTWYAASHEALSSRLFENQIALIDARQTTLLFRFPLTQQYVVESLRDIALLLQAGIPIAQAFYLASEQAPHYKLQDMLHIAHEQVLQGRTVSSALRQTPSLLDGTMLHIIHAGEESGKLPDSLMHIVQYYQTKDELKKLIRRALVVPLCTVACFFFVGIMVLIMVVPRIQLLYQTLRKTPPQSVQIMTTLSTTMTPQLIIGLSTVTIVLCYGLFRLLKIPRIRSWITRISMTIPGVRTVIGYRFCVHFFTSMGIMLEGGIPVVAATDIILSQEQNPYFKHLIGIFQDELLHGKTVYQALTELPELFFVPECLAFIRIGQESATLPEQFLRAAQFIKNKLFRLLWFIATLIQPLLLVIIAIGILILVIAIYEPILSLSSSF